MDKKVERVKFTEKPSIKRKRVAAYARVSTGKDAMRHSLAAQVSYDGICSYRKCRTL